MSSIATMVTRPCCRSSHRHHRKVSTIPSRMCLAFSPYTTRARGITRRLPTSILQQLSVASLGMWSEGCRLDDKFDPLLAGGMFSQAVNTVSENYARELQYSGQDALTGWLGHAFLAHGIQLTGITNGVDPDAYDPRNAELLGLAAPFSPIHGDLDGKSCARNRCWTR